MALTIAVGFVVDDAIVMLRTFYRHIEEACADGAALKGAAKSLYHRIDQLLADRGVHSALLMAASSAACSVSSR